VSTESHTKVGLLGLLKQSELELLHVPEKAANDKTAAGLLPIHPRDAPENTEYGNTGHTGNTGTEMQQRFLFLYF